jgi:integrase/recombinase XerD
MAYARAVKQFFDLWWCEERRLVLDDIEPMTVAAYIEQLGPEVSKPTVKQHLAAIRQLFDYLVTGGLLPSNPGGLSPRPYLCGNAGQDTRALRRRDATAVGLHRHE